MALVATEWGVTIVVVLFCAAFFGILLYSLLWARTPRDILGRPLCAPHWCTKWDGWGWTHLLLYFVAGLLLPGRYATFAVIGVAWEMIEYASGATLYYFGAGPKSKWWYAKWTDLLANMTGYVLGSALATLGPL